MNLKKWLKGTTSNEREEVCRLADTKVRYLFQLSCGHRLASPKLTQKLVYASAVVTPDRRLTLDGIRPDIWGGGASATTATV